MASNLTWFWTALAVSCDGQSCSWAVGYRMGIEQLSSDRSRILRVWQAKQAGDSQRKISLWRSLRKKRQMRGLMIAKEFGWSAKSGLQLDLDDCVTKWVAVKSKRRRGLTMPIAQRRSQWWSFERHPSVDRVNCADPHRHTFSKKKTWAKKLFKLLPKRM